MAIKVNVLELCGERVATGDDAAVIRSEVIAAWAAGEFIQVDFGNALIASVSFLDHAVGALALTHDLDEIWCRVDCIHMNELDEQLLQSIFQLRARHRSRSLAKPRTTP